MNEAELLFTHVLKCDRPSLYSRKRRLEAGEARCIADCLRRRINGEPLQYILGKADFMGMEFFVDPAVLIPRPETELLVETAARYAKKAAGTPVILDTGTGSGNICVSLAKLVPGAEIHAIDISRAALALAARNAAANGVGEKIDFVLGDMSSDCGIAPGSCSIVVSNPPYVRSAEIAGLQPEVRHEPRLALDGGEDGLVFYRCLAKQAGGWLRGGGMLLLEMGAGQHEAVRGILEAGGHFTVRETISDYCGIQRITAAQRN